MAISVKDIVFPVAALAFLGYLLTGHTPPPTETTTASPPATAPAPGPVALDRSTAAVNSCSIDEMFSMTNGTPTVSVTDAAAICETIARSLGHRPPVNVLRASFKVTSLIHDQGSKPEIAYQLMNIVETRGITNPDRIMSTFDIVWRIYAGTGGHVTPRDLNITLRSAGPKAAHGLSDDGLVSMATLIWEQKKASGE
jgi:hypothetical protein